MSWLPDFSAWRWHDWLVLALLLLGPVAVLVWVMRVGGMPKK